MNKINNLTQGTIIRALWIIALPLISSSFVQMAYNMTDMLWLGNLGSDAVAAVGAAGFFMWLGNAISLLPKTAAEITVSQCIGASDTIRAKEYANQSTTLAFIVATCYAFFLLLCADQLVSMFHFTPEIATNAANYLRIVTPGIFFTISNNCMSGIYNGLGDSKTPFKIVATGLVANIVLDPILIYGAGITQGLGTAGAGIATTLAQLIVFILFIVRVYNKKFALGALTRFSKIKKYYTQRLIRLGAPLSVENGLFALFSMTLSTLASGWGYQAVATFSIGSQIEAISWMTAGGFSTALAAFMGQNYGARNWNRMNRGYYVMMAFAGSIGLFAAILFFFFGDNLFWLFVKDDITINMGATYMKVLALSQVFMVFELVTIGAYNGTGNTMPPAVWGTILTAIRIPMALGLTRLPALGVAGIWWSITISTFLKGTILPALFIRLMSKIKLLFITAEEEKC
ncbi:MAG: MATE family efflux transporter [Marinifilaceae bacterium]